MSVNRPAETTNPFASIPIHKQDPGSRSPHPGRSKKRAKYKHFLRSRQERVFSLGKGGRFGIGVFFFAILLPFSFAHAGILSFVGEIFADLNFTKEFLGVPINSQTMALLEAVRNSDPTPRESGPDVTIVDGSAIAPRSTPDSSESLNVAHNASNDQISVYVVRNGDTLSQIADMFGVSVNTVLWSNNIAHGGNIQVGQKLVILPVSGLRYIIKKGDTIAKIASAHKADADEIRSFNGIEDGALAIGDTIIIPNGIESVSTSATRTTSPSGTKYIATNGYFVRPVPGWKTQGIHGHNGIDFHAPTGTPVVAAAEGTVIISRSSGWNGGYGQYVVIKHPNGTQTLYSHLSRNAISEGQYVPQGQIIGYSGATGKSYGPHLHFEVRGGVNPF